MENIKGIISISGMGGGYEEACQTMLQAGYEWLQKNKKATLKAETIQNVFGILTPKSKDAEALSKAATDCVEDCTGAMHQAVMSHLFFINKNGVEAWIEEGKKRKQTLKEEKIESD